MLVQQIEIEILETDAKNIANTLPNRGLIKKIKSAISEFLKEKNGTQVNIEVVEDDLFGELDELKSQAPSEIDPEKIQQLTQEARALKNILSAESACIILSLNIGNSSLTREILEVNLYLKKDILSSGQSVHIGRMKALIETNMKQRAHENASLIITIMEEKFNIFLPINVKERLLKRTVS